MKPLSFLTSFLLALLATALGGAIGLGIVPAQPSWIGKVAALGMLLITWTNTVLGNPLAKDVPTEQSTLTVVPDDKPKKSA